MKFMTVLDKMYEYLFDRPPLRHAVGMVAVGVGALNILDVQSGIAYTLLRLWDAWLPLVVAFMALVVLSGLVIMFSPAPPHPAWYSPLIIYLALTITGYLLGALLGFNTWGFALKAMFSIGLAFWLLIRALRGVQS